MRVRSRLVLGFCGVAMAVPAASTASAQDGQPYASAPYATPSSAGGAPAITLQHMPDAQPAAGGMPMASPAPGASVQPAPAPHHHHGLLGRRHCVACQRARVKSHDGVEIPPPPGYPGGPALAPGETIVSGPVVVSEHVVGSNAPGYAVVGGAESAPGYAVLNGEASGNEPVPVGVARGGLGAAAGPRMAAAMPRGGPGSYDPAVMQSSVPPPPTPVSGPGHNRPHIISHILGLPILGAHHQKELEKERQQHAAIAYGDPDKTVTELPASVVYGEK